MTKTTKKEPVRKSKADAEPEVAEPAIKEYNTIVCGHSAPHVRAKKISIPGGSIDKFAFIAANVVVEINSTSRQLTLPIRKLNHEYKDGQEFDEKDRESVLGLLWDNYPPGKSIRVIERRRNNRTSYEIEKA